MQEIVLAVWQRILKTVDISMIILSAFFIANDLVMSIAILAIGAWMLFLSLMAFEEDCKVIPLVKEQEYMDALFLTVLKTILLGFWPIFALYLIIPCIITEVIMAIFWFILILLFVLIIVVALVNLVQQVNQARSRKAMIKHLENQDPIKTYYL